MSKSGMMLNAGGLVSAFGSMGDAIPASGKQNMKIAASELEGEIKDRAPVDTGHLRASYTHNVEESGDKVIGRVGTNVEYASHQEYMGTPHVRPAVDARGADLARIMGSQTLNDAIGHVR